MAPGRTRERASAVPPRSGAALLLKTKGERADRPASWRRPPPCAGSILPRSGEFLPLRSDGPPPGLPAPTPRRYAATMPPFARPAAFVFDLGGVLVQFDEAPLRPLFRPEVDSASFWRFVVESREYRAFELGPDGTEAMGAAAVATLCRPGVTVPAFLDALRRWADTVTPEAIACVERARSLGIPLAMLSNTNPLHWPGLAPRLAAPFDHLVLSYRTGHLKPSPGAFAAVEALVGAANLVFFDDNAHNVAAAAARGWRAVQVRGPADVLAWFDTFDAG